MEQLGDQTVKVDDVVQQVLSDGTFDLVNKPREVVNLGVELVRLLARLRLLFVLALDVLRVGCLTLLGS